MNLETVKQLLVLGLELFSSTIPKIGKTIIFNIFSINTYLAQLYQLYVYHLIYTMLLLKRINHQQLQRNTLKIVHIVMHGIFSIYYLVYHHLLYQRHSLMHQITKKKTNNKHCFCK